MAESITNIYAFGAADYDKDSGDEIQDSAASNDIFPYVIKSERFERLGEPLRFVFTVAAGSEWNKNYLLKSRHRLYVTYSDASVIPVRISEVRFNAASGNVRVEAEHLWADLSNRHLAYVREPDSLATLQFPLARLTFDEILDIIFDTDYGMPSIFVKGTVDASVSSKSIMLPSRGATFAELLREACSLAGAEFEVVYSSGNPGTVTFNFDEKIGTQTSASDRPVSSGAGNRFTMSVDDAQEGYFSRILPFADGDGEAVSMADGWLYVESGTENGPGVSYEWTLKGSPFAMDDMFTENNAYFVELYTTADPNEIRADLVIADVVAATSTLTTASTGLGGVSPNDVIKLRIHSTQASGKTGTGSRVNFINDYTSETSKGVVEEARFYDDVSGYDNLFEVIAGGSGDMSDGTTDGNGNYIPTGMNLVEGEIRATINSIDISGVSGFDEIYLDGDHTNYLSSLESVTATGTTDNDGTYTLAASPIFASGETEVRITESMPGTDQGSAGGLLTYTGFAVSSSVSSAQYINNGDASMKVTADAGHKVRTDAISITATQQEPYITVWASVAVEQGKVAMWVERDADSYRDFDPVTYSGKEIRAMVLENSGVVDIGTTKDIRVYWEALEDDTIFHIDALAVTQHKGVGEVPFRQYMGTTGLMERANIDLLKEGGELKPQFVSDFFDFEYHDAGTYEEIHLGCTVELKDLPDGAGSFAIDETPRVIEIQTVESINGRPQKKIKIAREKKRIDKRLSLVGGTASLSTKSISKPNPSPVNAKVIGARNLVDAAATDMATGFKIIHDEKFGGTFRHDPTGYSSQADNVISYPTGDGRLIERIFTGPLQAIWTNPTLGATDESTKIQLAIDTAISRRISEVNFGPFQWEHGSTIDLDGVVGLELSGHNPTAADSGSAVSTRIKYTGSSGSAWSLRDATGVVFRKLRITYSGATGVYTDRLIDLRGDTIDTSQIVFEDCNIFGIDSSARGATLIDLARSHTIRFSRCYFFNSDVSISGTQSVSGDETPVANNILFDSCLFKTAVTSHVKNGGQAWTFLNCTYEPLTNGTPGAFIGHDSSLTKVNGMNWMGCWAGDISGGTAGAQIEMNGNNFQVEGGFWGIGGNALVETTENNLTGLTINSWVSGDNVTGTVLRNPMTGLSDVRINGEFNITKNTWLPTGASGKPNNFVYNDLSNSYLHHASSRHYFEDGWVILDNDQNLYFLDSTGVLFNASIKRTTSDNLLISNSSSGKEIQINSASSLGAVVLQSNSVNLLKVVNGRVDVEGKFRVVQESITISSGSITPAKSYVKVKSEGAGADDLDTISGASSGNLLFLTWDSTGGAVTITESGNVVIEGSATSFTLDSQSQFVTLLYNNDNAKWILKPDVGNVITASASLTDNTILRGDGGSRGIQDTGITIDDSDNIDTGTGDLDVGGDLLITNAAKVSNAVNFYFLSAGGLLNARIYRTSGDDLYILNSTEDVYINANTAFKTVNLQSNGTTLLTAVNGRIDIKQELKAEGALNHDGSTAGFFGTTPATQPAAVSDPSGGATVDAEARSAINDIIDALQSLGLMA